MRVSFIVLAALFTVLLLGIVPAEAQKADRAWNACQKTADPDRRITACTSVVARGDREQIARRSGAYTLRGNAHFQKGAIDKAIRDHSRAIRLVPRNFIALGLRGTAYIAKGEHDRALKDLNAAFKLNSKDSSVLFNRGMAYFFKGDQERALADYSEAIRLDPKNVQAWFTRGTLQFGRNDPDRALADFDAAIRIDPSFSFAYNGRAQIYAAAGENDRAIADYSEAVRLNPTLAIAWFSRGTIYVAKGEHDRGIADFDEAIRLNPNFPIWYNNRGGVHFSKGAYDRAIADFDAAVERDPTFALAFVNRGMAYAAAGKHEQAIKDYDEGLRLDPKNALALSRRGDAFAVQGDHHRALADYSAALEIDPAVVGAAEGRKQATVALERNNTGSVGEGDRSSGTGQNRIALVVGIDQYRNVESLRAARNDARAVATAFKGLGFEVALLEDPGREEMAAALAELERKTGNGDTVAFFFAGQGLWNGARNFLLAADMPLIGNGMESRLEQEAFAADRIMERLNARGARAAILVLDACRDNPFARTGASSPAFAGARGLKRMTPPRGAFVLLPAEEGTAALERLDENDANPNSVFGRIFAEELGRPGARLADVALTTQERVNALARTVQKDQLPTFQDGFVGRFALK